jgi:hypothetical protein
MTLFKKKTSKEKARGYLSISTEKYTAAYDAIDWTKKDEKTASNPDEENINIKNQHETEPGTKPFLGRSKRGPVERKPAK